MATSEGAWNQEQQRGNKEQLHLVMLVTCYELNGCKGHILIRKMVKWWHQCGNNRIIMMRYYGMFWSKLVINIFMAKSFFVCLKVTLKKFKVYGCNQWPGNTLRGFCVITMTAASAARFLHFHLHVDIKPADVYQESLLFWFILVMCFVEQEGGV